MDGDLLVAKAIDWRNLPVHPAADLLPPLTDDELADLAADIKANGLNHPIVLAHWTDEHGDIIEGVIDGRHRLKACEIAGVEPRFERANGTTKLFRFAVSENISRRHLSTGQIAMTLALARRAAPEEFRPDPVKIQSRGRGRPKDPQSDHALARIAGIPQQRITEAELVIKHAPTLVPKVMSNAMRLDNAYRQAASVKKAEDWADKGMELLRKAAPDLAARVDRDEISLDEAQVLLDASQKVERERRHTVLHGLSDFLRQGRQLANFPEHARELPTWLEVEEYAEEFRQYFKGGIDEFKSATEVLDDAIATIKQISEALKTSERGE